MLHDLGVLTLFDTLTWSHVPCVLWDIDARVPSQRDHGTICIYPVVAAEMYLHPLSTVMIPQVESTCIVFR